MTGAEVASDAGSGSVRELLLEPQQVTAKVQAAVSTVTREAGGIGSRPLVAYVSLVVLVVQNASQVLLIRYARTRPREDMFLSTTAVFFSELLKLVSCLLIMCAGDGPVRTAKLCYKHIIGTPWDTAKVCVPSAIYTIQNNLLYVAVSHLTAATFMVTYQLKILTTALFSVAMLGRKLTAAQWAALALLFAGVSLVQLQELNPSAKADNSNSTSPSPNPNSTSALAHQKLHERQRPLLGLSAVVVACILSGFAGVYFEKMLKGGPDVSVWLRNIQLAVLSLPISYFTMMAKDGSVVRSRGMLFGYDALVWAIIGTYALGGLTVAVVIKFADNILKGFATSVAIVVATLASVVLFAFEPTGAFVAGAALVIASVYIYSKFPYIAPPTQRYFSRWESLWTISHRNLRPTSFHISQIKFLVGCLAAVTHGELSACDGCLTGFYTVSCDDKTNCPCVTPCEKMLDIVGAPICVTTTISPRTTMSSDGQTNTREGSLGVILGILGGCVAIMGIIFGVLYWKKHRTCKWRLCFRRRSYQMEMDNPVFGAGQMHDAESDENCLL